MKNLSLSSNENNMRKFIIKLTKTEKKINHRYDFESPLNLDTARVNFEKVIGIGKRQRDRKKDLVDLII